MTRSEKLLLSLSFLFCLAIRIAFIDQKNLWFDEVFSWNISSASFYEIIVRTTNDIHPPLYYFILKIWNICFGDSIFSMRLLSAVCTSSAVFFIYGISKRFMASTMCIVTVLLYCISPLNLYYSQEVRMAGMNLLFNIAVVYYFIRILETTDNEKKILKKPVFLLYVMFQTAALYTHYFSFFILAGLILFLIFHNKSKFNLYQPFLVAYSAVLVLFALWLPALVTHIERGQAWRQKQNYSNVLTEIFNYSKDVSLGLYYHYTNLQYIGYISWFLVGLSLLLIIFGFIKTNKSFNINYPQLVGLVLLVPLVIAVAISLNQKIEFYRYLSILVPYICIMMVYLLLKVNIRSIAVSIIILFGAVNVFGDYLHFKFDFKNDDYREIVKDINSNYSEGERIYVYPHYCGWIINYMKKQDNLKIPNFVDHRYDWNVLMDSLHTQNPNQFWVVMDYSAVDTSGYKNYISELKSEYARTFEKNYPMAPARVEVYRFRVK